MANTAITVENLSKAYRIGLKEEMPDTFVAAATGWIKAPFRNYQRLKRLDTFSDHRDSDDIIWALKDVSFEVKEGEVLGIIGPNGAGKSTLLKILSRITEPTSGRAIIRGRVSSLLEVGTGFHPELTGRENIYMNGTILGMTKREIDRKFDDIVDFSGVAKFLDTPIKRYSSGMQVRLAFAVAAHLEPEILIIDEVLAVGDAEFQKRCLGKMENIAKGGRTVLFVSHNMGAVKKLCHRCVLLRNGAAVADGTTSEVVDSYLLAGQTSASGDVPADAPRIGLDHARLVSVYLENSQGMSCSELGVGEPFRVRLCFDVRKPIKGVHVELLLAQFDGSRVLSALTQDFGLPPLEATPGRLEVVAAPDVYLLPGAYCIGAGLHFENGTTIDFVERAMDFAVLRIARGSDYAYPWSVVKAPVRPFTKWLVTSRTSLCDSKQIGAGEPVVG